MNQLTKVYQHYLLFLKHLEDIKRSIFAFLFCLPTSLRALLLFLLLVYNGCSVFYVHLPLPAKSPREPAGFSPATENPLKKPSSPVMYSVKEENPPVISKTHLPLLQKPAPRRARKRKSVSRILWVGSKNSERFSTRIREFFGSSECKVRFFMTWISSLESFGNRELFAIESLFKTHPNACLVMVSNSMGSEKGSLMLKPFWEKGFKAISIKPDYDFIFRNTYAQSWFNELKKGYVDPGEVSLGQNLSNLLRLALLYKFGGVYIDTDMILLKHLGKLRNVIGAQTIDLGTGNWSRLNNAVLIFDKNHPLLFKFIQEFALTFNGNKWGHNGPYLVSRVVSRVKNRPGFDNFTVLHPSVFYPVNWSRIRSIFRGPRDNLHSKWLQKKLKQIKRESFGLHLWNKHSRNIRVEDGSIISHIMAEYCIFCNSSSSNFIHTTWK